MKWLLKILGIKSSVEKKKAEVAKLREKAFKAQRNGDLSLAGQYLSEAEALEAEIANESDAS